jgi:hypothetical protein
MEMDRVFSEVAVIFDRSIRLARRVVRIGIKGMYRMRQARYHFHMAIAI